MSLAKLAFVAVPIMTVGVLVADCSSTNLVSPKHDSGTDVPVVSRHDSGRDVAFDAAMNVPHDSGPDVTQGPGGCSGRAPTRSDVPPSHRATAAACSPNGSVAPDAGMSCTSNADCDADAGAFLLRTCLHGHCTSDQCFTDTDCGPNGVCDCAKFTSLARIYGAGGGDVMISGVRSGGAGAPGIIANVCLSGNCRVDNDCGPGGYCSPSAHVCGGTNGYYCHTAKDTCVDAAKNCTPLFCGFVGSTCSYSPTTGSFACDSSPCGG